MKRRCINIIWNNISTNIIITITIVIMRYQRKRETKKRLNTFLIFAHLFFFSFSFSFFFFFFFFIYSFLYSFLFIKSFLSFSLSLSLSFSFSLSLSFSFFLSVLRGKIFSPLMKMRRLFCGVISRGSTLISTSSLLPAWNKHTGQNRLILLWWVVLSFSLRIGSKLHSLFNAFREILVCVMSCLMKYLSREGFGMGSLSRRPALSFMHCKREKRHTGMPLMCLIVCLLLLLLLLLLLTSIWLV